MIRLCGCAHLCGGDHKRLRCMDFENKLRLPNRATQSGGGMDNGKLGVASLFTLQSCDRQAWRGFNI